MAKRLVFIPILEKPYYLEKEIEFQFYTGFAKQQKLKSIESLHNTIYNEKVCSNILEISTSSALGLGYSLSAFKLTTWSNITKSEVFIENIFQSSKKFDNGGPFLDILNVDPWTAKKDDRLISSGNLIAFELESRIFPLTPKSAFYDWLYIGALMRKKELWQELSKFDGFTDIEFNHAKSFNCQARSVAIFVGLLQSDNIKSVLKSFESFCEIYLPSENFSSAEQLTLFNLL